MKRTLPLSCLLVLATFTAGAEARREPRQSFKPVRFLTGARVDDQFHLPPYPPTRSEQLRPLPSFWAAPGSPGSNGRGVHASIWNRVRHYDWAQQEAARDEVQILRVTGPRRIVLMNRSGPSTQPTTRPTSSGPIIELIRIR